MSYIPNSNRYSSDVQRNRSALMSDSRPMVPDPLTSDREAARFYHKDIPDLSVEQMQSERIKILIILSDSTRQSWERERLAELDDELRHRGYQQIQPAHRRSESRLAERISTVSPDSVVTIDELLAKEEDDNGSS